MAFDPSKPVQTRDGRAVRILPERAKNPSRSLVGLITNDLGHEFADSWREDGGHHEGGKSLVNVPESKWMNLYEEHEPHGHPLAIWLDSKDKAEASARVSIPHRRIAIVELTAAGEFIITKVDK